MPKTKVAKKAALYGLPFKTLDALHPTTRQPMEIHIVEHVEIDLAGDINKQVAMMPGIYAWYGQMYEDAQEELSLRKHNELNTYERLYVEIRDQLDKKGVSETEIKMRVANHADMKKAWHRRMRWENRTKRLKQVMEALRMKADMLQSLGANQRSEMRVKKAI